MLHNPAQQTGCDCADERSDERNDYGKSDAFFLASGKVDCGNVKSGFGRTEDAGGAAGYVRVCAVPFENLG